ncbi:penicillin acylase family protein [Paucibacter soli]|uniref:penicillin acylase family protein n=1 Tax=Paucibacter soli TaxID=3133433 RepID=UPI0030B1869D
MSNSRIVRTSARLLAGLLALLLLVGLLAWCLLRASLPQLDGEIQLPGLKAPLAISRDALGTAVLQGREREDLARGLGYLHAQERFFEMDLARRSAAGELAALFGDKALERDRTRRLHRMRARLGERFAQLPAADRALLGAYASGVNAGLQALRLRPWQYLLLRAEPAPWTEVDSLLVVGEMFFMLQAGSFEAGFERSLLRERAGDALFDWLNPRGGRWDAALDGSTLAPPPMPSAEQFDLRALPAPKPALAALVSTEEALPGSNNWAVAGQRSKHGGAILADDMHLGLGVPSIWYRAQLQLGDDKGRMQRAAGLTLPGMPSLVVGSNGQVAWGFTNAYGQWFDWIKLPTPPAMPAPERLRSLQERIEVKGGTAQALVVQEFDGAPVAMTRDGQRYALRWIAHQGEAYNLELDRLATARDVAEAAGIAQRAGMPQQNILIADKSGHIAWTIAGRLWRQAGLSQRYARFQSTEPPELAAPGWLDARDYPLLRDPDEGQLWSANHRQLGGAAAETIGDGGFDLGARAQQIRDRLSETARHDEATLAAIHFDNEARFMQSWAARIGAALQGSSAHTEVARQLQQWNGRADADQVGYRLARAVRLKTLDALWTAWTLPLLGEDQQDEKKRFKWRAQFEYSAVQALEARPDHLLPPGYSSWQAFVLAQVDAALLELTQDGRQALAQASWGQHNASRIQHVLSRAIPALGRWLDMPSLPQGGDSHLPHVAQPAFGQSQRLVVSPGREAQATLSMPGGQSGHPLSPYYGAGHAAWAAGQATPLLAGPAQHQLNARAQP